MLSLELRFPTGKWHATPWGRQVNEGAVEWPPSPWRLLRALISVWHHKFPDVSVAVVQSLLQALIPPPVYRLPPISHGHTRHYMPAAGDLKTKIFDTFTALSPQNPILVCWPDVTLSNAQRDLLRQLLEAMSYLGRAESWVIATLSDWDGTSPNASPFQQGESLNGNAELVRMLSPTPGDVYAQWRSTMLDDLKQRKLADKRVAASKKGKPPEKEKLSAKDLAALEATLPADWFDALHSETNDLRKAGWNRPPGSEWIDYKREKQLPVILSATVSQSTTRPTVARYAIAGAVRPRLTDALFIGERVRTSLIRFSDGAAVFVGRDTASASNHISQGHHHAHYLCESNNDAQGRITHVTVFSPQGFTASDEQALSFLRRTWGDGGHDLQFVLLGVGTPADFGGIDEKKGQSPILALSDVWTSRTPFVPADRLRRKYNLNDPDDRRRCQLDLARMIRKELSRRDWHDSLGQDVIVEELLDHTELAGRDTKWLKFRRTRTKGGGKQGDSNGYGLRLRFSSPVQGPIVLGYGAHFGLGQFTPLKE